jgi:hypothetical protein
MTSLVCKEDPVPLSCSSSFQRILIFSSTFSPAAAAPIYCPLYPEEYQQDYYQDKEYVQDSGSGYETVYPYSSNKLLDYCLSWTETLQFNSQPVHEAIEKTAVSNSWNFRVRANDFDDAFHH